MKHFVCGVHMADGFVYVLKNKHVPRLVKVGYTDRNPAIRAEELSSFTGVPGKWVVCKSWFLANAYSWEQRIFTVLADHRETGEFFKLIPDAAVEIISVFLSVSGAIDESGLTEADKREIERAKETQKELEVKLRLKQARDDWDREKQSAFKQAMARAEREYGKTLDQINDYDSIGLFGTIFSTLYVFMMPFIWVPMMLVDIVMGLLGKDSKPVREETRPSPDELERRALFEIRARIFYSIRRQFFVDRGVQYPFDDNDPV
jgi:hypothetical protein